LFTSVCEKIINKILQCHRKVNDILGNHVVEPLPVEECPEVEVVSARKKKKPNINMEQNMNKLILKKKELTEKYLGTKR